MGPVRSGVDSDMGVGTKLARLRALIDGHPDTRHRRAAAWARVAYWQARSRITVRPMVMRFANGSRLWVWPGRPASTAAWYVGLPDYAEMTFLLHLLRPGDLFVDGGANVGVWSVLAASTGAAVVAVEPVAATADLLECQGELNRLGPRLRVARCALSDAPGVVTMTADEDVGNHIVASASPQGKGVAVPCDTLDRVCTGGTPVAVKLDLEGHELAALRGAGRILADAALLAVVVETFRPHNWQLESLRELERLLYDHGLTPHDYDPAARELVPLTEPSAGGQNTIFARVGAELTTRLNPAKAGRAGG